MFEEIGSTALFLCLIVLLISLILLTLLVLLIHSGLFTPVKEVGTGKPPLGKVAIAYKFQKGPYNESGQTFTEAHIIAPNNKCVGIYYDDPKKVPSHELRYAVGCILGSDIAEVDPDLLSRFNEKGFKSITLPEVEYAVQTSFPHVTTLSILIGIHKAYPRLCEYIEERKLCAHPFLEFYNGDHIHFFAPLSKQEEFWVPECQQHFDGRGDETADTSDMNTTLDTSHSIIGDESVLSDDTPRATPDIEVTNKSSDVLEVSLEKEVGKVSDGGGDGSNDTVGSVLCAGVEDDVNENGGGNGEDDDNDNSSSSSFEVLKNEAVE